MSESLREIRIFVAVYEERSFTAAAEREHATQSGVSQHVRKLEERLGARLLSRDGGRVSPTPAGDDYYQACLDVLRAHDRARQRMARFAKGLHGEVVVGLMPTMTRSALAPAAERFMRAHPNVALRVIEAYSAELTKAVRAGELDFAIVPGPVSEAGVRSAPFGRTPELVVSGRRRGLRAFAPVRLADLSPVKIVVPGKRNARHAHIESYLASAGVAVSRRLELDSMFGTQDFVAGTDWITILPGIMIVAEAGKGSLVVNPLIGRPFVLDLVLIEPLRRQMSDPAAAFLQLLRASTNALGRQVSASLGKAR